MILQGKAKTPVREVILHCSATPKGYFDKMSAFQIFSIVNKWHHERGFKNGFGYHGIIMPDGQFYSGRPLNMVGAHVIGKNAGTWGVLLIEKATIKEMGEFEDYYTYAQALALTRWLRSYPQIERVTGHNQYAPKLCPGFNVQSSDWL